MKLSRYEQETVINYNEAETTASVYTHDTKLLAKLSRLAAKYPRQVWQEGENSYPVPKSCIFVREPYSDERRAAARERAKLSGSTPPPRGLRSKME